MVTIHPRVFELLCSRAQFFLHFSNSCEVWPADGSIYNKWGIHWSCNLTFLPPPFCQFWLPVVLKFNLLEMLTILNHQLNLAMIRPGDLSKCKVGVAKPSLETKQWIQYTDSFLFSVFSWFLSVWLSCPLSAGRMWTWGRPWTRAPGSRGRTATTSIWPSSTTTWTRPLRRYRRPWTHCAVNPSGSQWTGCTEDWCRPASTSVRLWPQRPTKRSTEIQNN